MATQIYSPAQSMIIARLLVGEEVIPILSGTDNESEQLPPDTWRLHEKGYCLPRAGLVVSPEAIIRSDSGESGLVIELDKCYVTEAFN